MIVFLLQCNVNTAINVETLGLVKCHSVCCANPLVFNECNTKIVILESVPIYTFSIYKSIMVNLSSIIHVVSSDKNLLYVCNTVSIKLLDLQWIWYIKII